MAERYDAAESDGCSYEWLSEWLCEYVDGTMDPSVRAVFEEYMAANPSLREHVESLRRTRELLGRCACEEQGMKVAKKLHTRLGRQSEQDLMQKHVPVLGRATDHVGTFMAVASAMSLMLGVGVFIGAFFFAEPKATSATATGTDPVEAVRTSAQPSASAQRFRRVSPHRPAAARAPLSRAAGMAPTPLFMTDSLTGARTLAGVPFTP